MMKNDILKRIRKHFLVLLFLFIGVAHVYSQQTERGHTLKELLQIAETNYPLLKSKALDVQAAQKGIAASQSTLIPNLDASYQVNYATYNNIVGMASNQFMIPMTGPVGAANNMNGVFGSATSLLLNWQPITFGQRKSQVEVAKAGLQYAKADADNEIFRHKIKVINAYLDVLTSVELLKVYQNNLQRTQANLRVVQSLVVSGIKPGVDTALFKAEVSKAKIDLLGVQKYQQQASITLSQLLATDSNFVFSDTTFFYRLPQILLASDSSKNPLVSLYSSNTSVSVARKKALAMTSAPTLGVWGTTYARGSGVSNTGAVDVTNGLGFQRFNYGIGLQLSVPILHFLQIRPQIQQQAFVIKSNEEKMNEVELQLRKQDELADTTLSNAFAVVQESPLFLESAEYSYKSLQSRYQSGLANFADLIQAQYGLVKAETDYKLNYMGVWKALLFKASVKGDLNLFINQVN
jgi:outer membrane protein TolC